VTGAIAQGLRVVSKPAMKRSPPAFRVLGPQKPKLLFQQATNANSWPWASKLIEDSTEARADLSTKNKC
jgi:hypothetical protein